MAVLEDGVGEKGGAASELGVAVVGDRGSWGKAAADVGVSAAVSRGKVRVST
jgi:hypothetical protein